MEAVSEQGVAALSVMWVAMMTAMMLPSSAPMALVYAGAVSRRAPRATAITSVGIFLLGYLLVWAAYGVAAAILQLALGRAGVLSPETMDLAGAKLKGLVVLTAGVYQWMPLKHLCLERCRSPLSFILLYWREGWFGALSMGIRHGSYCVGCCWTLMLLLFVGGVMNLWWIAALTCLVLAERLIPHGPLLARASGLLMTGAGLYLFFAA